jgi:hypothetical protein
MSSFQSIGQILTIIYLEVLKIILVLTLLDYINLYAKP